MLYKHQSLLLLLRLGPFENLMKTTLMKHIYIWGSLKRRSRLYDIILCYRISLLNETNHIFGSTDSCILYIKQKMPWQPLFLSKCRIICVVHFLYSKHKWREEGKSNVIWLPREKPKKEIHFLKITNTCSITSPQWVCIK